MRVLFYGTGHLVFARRDSAMAQGTWPKPLAKAKRMLLWEVEIPLPRFARSNSKKTLVLSPPAEARCLSFWQNVPCRGLPPFCKFLCVWEAIQNIKNSYFTFYGE